MFSFAPRSNRHLSIVVVLAGLTYLTACGEAPTEPSVSTTPSFSTAAQPVFTAKPTVTVQKVVLRIISFDGCVFHQFANGIITGHVSTTTWAKTDGSSWFSLKGDFHGDIVDQDGNEYTFGWERGFSVSAQLVGTFQAYESDKYRLIFKGHGTNEFLTFKSSLMLLADGTYVPTSVATLECK